MAIQTITDENFEEKVMKNAKPFLIRFTAEWCGELPPSLIGRGVCSSHLKFDLAKV